MTTILPAWRRAWEGIAPSLPTAGLAALAEALASDSPKLLQGSCVDPPALPYLHEAEPERACAVGLACWKGANLRTVREVDAAFNRAVDEASVRLGDPSGVSYFLNWFDGENRGVVRYALLAEVKAELARRNATPGAGR